MANKAPGLSYEAHKKLEAERAVEEVAIVVAGTAITALLLLHLLPVWGPVLVAALVGAAGGWVLPRRVGWRTGVTMVLIGALGVVLLSMVAHDVNHLTRIGRRWNPHGFRVDANVLGRYAPRLVVWGLPWLLTAVGVIVLWRAYQTRGENGHADDLGDGELVIEGH